MASGKKRGPVSDPGEIHYLRNCVSNLISLHALPAICAGREPSRHLSVLLEALIPMLHLAFVYARAIDTAGDRVGVVSTAVVHSAEVSEVCHPPAVVAESLSHEPLALGEWN